MTSTSVTWTVPTAVDNDEIATFISNYQPPDIFRVGSREVVYIATDKAGNFEDCNFFVTVTGWWILN